MALINCPECSREISNKAVSCPHCGFPLPELIAAYTCKFCNKEFPFSDELCPHCGFYNAQRHSKKQGVPTATTTAKKNGKGGIKCPRCKTKDTYTTDNKGFGLGKAAIGGVLMGPVGLLGGLIGSKQTMLTCLNCGHKWELRK
ncbi:double zinc ribbon domain-containing protein [Geoanaerobacter pelophilus]|uniref:double zinc ribbon domain-containing protein n=1 Tax=Geoanaerobacter pelophilus TaxID=60036 RepID=UPI00135651DB|nr:zinc ribbon domain-containing protein [Geoanaerobacter pelophilus]